jgi:pimeloyl-ACP methyl ester carboxylesterase
MQPYKTFEEICAGLARHREAWAAIRDRESDMPLLPLLEHRYSVVAAQLVDGLVAAGLPRVEAERVSLRELMVFALTGPMRWGWGGYAISWIEAGFPIDDEIASALEQVAQDKRFLQRERHRAFAAARRWRRAHGDPMQAGGRSMAVVQPRRKPGLVLLPGLDGTGLLFRSFHRALDSDISATIVSYPRDRDMDYAGLEDVARSFLPRKKPFVLLAESFSGPIAISIAASRPAGLCGLILTCSFARNPRPLLALPQSLMRLLPIGAMPTTVLAWPAFGRFATPVLRSELADALSRVSPSVIKGRLRAVLDVDVSALIARVDVPVLYLRASEDRLVSRAASEELSAAPRIRFAEIEGPHFLLQAKPSAAAAHVQAFLSEIEVV